MAADELLSSFRNRVEAVKFTVLLGFSAAVLSTVLFFNHPSLMFFVKRFLLLTSAGALIGYSKDVSDLRFSLVAVIFISVASLNLLPADGCLLGDPSFSPHKNIFTGEVDHGDWDGIRYMKCDRNEYPWYYRDLTANEKEDWCELPENQEHFYCRAPRR